ncbi:MAG TPA: hypothetical protein VJ483_07985 [Holophagaceae bacterium]|nr:hypothetical protein [Holophagaceae bacterium]
MRLRPLLVLAAAAMGLRAQDYFKEPTRNVWVPDYELWAMSERMDLVPPASDFERTRSRLRLRWTIGEDTDVFQLRLGSAHYLGSDSNADNIRWFDNEPSNGSRIDMAALRLQKLSESFGFRAEGGLVENTLIASESLWDNDLRIIGGTGNLFWRGGAGEGFHLDEIGLRGAKGKARLLDGGRVDISAGQLVVKASGAGVDITLHGGVWTFDARPEDAANFARQNQFPYYPGEYVDTRFRFKVYGASIALPFEFPLELKGIRHVNQDTKDRGEEFQAWLGSPAKVWWPQFGYVRQRLDRTGALASVNGDLWWFHANADGQRYAIALNLPARWRMEVSRVEQTLHGASTPVKRSAVSLIKRF